ncbi:hypothetical protein [Streptomyces sp. SS]|uniref:hypothetical protein n=1 Tax=Streptomyces sp. SS TaxID=260742 RepID=UPI00036752C5|nr:hypothetical protein [Streptomyces sp. SS]
MALASAVATLLAALFLCLGAGPDREDPHHEPGESLRAVTVVGEYVCPYDRGGCSLFPSLSPAVLSAPPLDPPLDAAGGPDDGPARRSGAQPRAPDLHVLQVLRT